VRGATYFSPLPYGAVALISPPELFLEQRGEYERAKETLSQCVDE